MGRHRGKGGKPAASEAAAAEPDTDATIAQLEAALAASANVSKALVAKWVQGTSLSDAAANALAVSKPPAGPPAAAAASRAGLGHTGPAKTSASALTTQQALQRQLKRQQGHAASRQRETGEAAAAATVPAAKKPRFDSADKGAAGQGAPRPPRLKDNVDDDADSRVKAVLNKGPRESPAAPGAATAFVSKSALRRQRKKEKLAQRQAGDDAPSTSNGAAKPRPAHVDKAAPRPPTEKAAAKPPAAAAAAPQPKKQLAPPSAKPTVPGGAPWKSNWTGDDLSEDADAERPENAEGSRIRVAPLELTVSPQFQVLVASAADEALPEKPSDGEQPAGPGAGPGGKPKLRIKKRSRQKNIRKDNRPPELKPDYIRNAPPGFQPRPPLGSGPGFAASQAKAAASAAGKAPPPPPKAFHPAKAAATAAAAASGKATADQQPPALKRVETKLAPKPAKPAPAPASNGVVSGGGQTNPLSLPKAATSAAGKATPAAGGRPGEKKKRHKRKAAADAPLPTV